VSVTFTTYSGRDADQPPRTVAYYVVGQNPFTVLVDSARGRALPPEFCPKIFG